MTINLQDIKPTVNNIALMLAITNTIPAFFIGGVIYCEMAGVKNPAYISWTEERKHIREELRVIASKKVRKKSDGKWIRVKLQQEELKREAELLDRFKALNKDVPSDTICPSIWQFCLAGI